MRERAKAEVSATHVPPTPLRRDARQPRPAEQAISPQVNFLINDIMRDVITRGTGRRALALGRTDLRGKTGTTDYSVDTWFNGFNDNLVTTVWVGSDDNRPLGESEEGGRTALPIWVDYMREALRGVPENRARCSRWHYRDEGERPHRWQEGRRPGPDIRVLPRGHAAHRRGIPRRQRRSSAATSIPRHPTRRNPAAIRSSER